jgi:pimeloyl-ACP methyl ester carboxylesterase
LAQRAGCHGAGAANNGAMSPPLPPRRVLRGLLPAVLLGALAPFALAQSARPAPPPLELKSCKLPGVEHGALCGVMKRPLDPAQPTGPRIDVHVAVLPALARHKRDDPVFFLAGGPGQSAIDVAGPVSAMLGRFLNRRDLVLVDQRGTGKSAPLVCDERSELTRPTADSGTAALLPRLAACRVKLQALPHGDLRQYTTTIAVQDFDAVRAALGVERVNVIGGSYGTRAALEYQRQYPQRVRRLVIDGVAPPDMVLPASFSRDGQAALDAVFANCERQPDCQRRWPTLRADWKALLARLPMTTALQHPVTGTSETVTIDRSLLLGMARAPLYGPALAAGLPAAIDAAARGGRFEPLLGLTYALLGNRGLRLAEGMHYSVICSEDGPKLEAGAGDAPGTDFGTVFAEMYRKVCRDWPRGAVPEAFYSIPPAPVAALVMSGGADPATPDRHGARVARALGAKARHLVVPEAGHGLLGTGCLRDLVFRFVDAADDAAALGLDMACAAAMPRPPVFVPPAAAAASTSTATGAPR